MDGEDEVDKFDLSNLLECCVEQVSLIYWFQILQKLFLYIKRVGYIYKNDFGGVELVARRLAK